MGVILMLVVAEATGMDEVTLLSTRKGSRAPKKKAWKTRCMGPGRRIWKERLGINENQRGEVQKKQGKSFRSGQWSPLSKSAERSREIRTTGGDVLTGCSHTEGTGGMNGTESPGGGGQRAHGSRQRKQDVKVCYLSLQVRRRR